MIPARWWDGYMQLQFAEKGRSREGADCWGLVSLVYKEILGVDLPDYLECYETTNDRDKLAKVIDQESNSKWQNIAPGDEKPLDVIIVNMRGLPMHVGIVTKPGSMIHCAKEINVCHERYDSMRWASRVKGFSRYAGASA